MLLDVIEELAGKHHRLRTVLLTSLMVVVGIVCLIMPSVVAGYLSIIIGALMTLVGGAGVAFRLAGRFEEKTRERALRSLWPLWVLSASFMAMCQRTSSEYPGGCSVYIKSPGNTMKW